MAADVVQLEALVLKTVPYGESDLVVHLFTRGRGKLAAFAHGARKSSKRFGGGLEPFGLLEAELSFRHGRSLADLKRVALTESHPALREDLGRLAHAGYATELVRELVREGEPHDALFELLVEMYRLLASRSPTALLLRAFELEALREAGFQPVLDACARCGREVEGAGLFDAEHGGVACRTCATSVALPLEGTALRLLRALQAGGLRAGLADETHLPVEPVGRALRAFIARHVRHDLKSLAFIHDVGAPE